MPEATVNIVFAGGPLAGKVQKQRRPEFGHNVTIHYRVKGEPLSHCYAGRYGGGRFFQLTYMGVVPPNCDPFTIFSAGQG